MIEDTLFVICHALVIPGWLLLVLLPRWKGTRLVTASASLVLAVGAIYTVVVLTTLGQSEGGFGSLEELSLLFQDRRVMLAGWIHYLAFDLFIGAWEQRDSQRLGIPHAFVVPCLALTFWLGPAGLLLYFVVRWTLKRSFMVGQ